MTPTGVLFGSARGGAAAMSITRVFVATALIVSIRALLWGLVPNFVPGTTSLVRRHVVFLGRGYYAFPFEFVVAHFGDHK